VRLRRELYGRQGLIRQSDSYREPQVSAVIQNLVNQPYKHGFVTDIESDVVAKGLNEDVIRLISGKKGEPEWLLEFRLKAYRHWLTMAEPTWPNVKYPKIDFQGISYYSAPKAKKKLASMDEVDPELLRTFEKLGVPMNERAALAGVAVDVIFDSVSVATTFRKKLAEVGVIFCSFSEAVKDHPELVQKYLGSVVPAGDNFYAALNSAVFTDGSFCFIPRGVRCPMELSTYFRINTQESGQFERTLIVAEEGAHVSYLEGCTAPKFDTNQLHAAVVELVALDNAEIKYSTVQNWYAGDENGKGGIYNFVTKRGLCKGVNSKISWTQVETGSAITWKYPSCILQGDNSVGEFYSVALTNHHQQADTGTKMVHIGKNTRSKIISKGISAGVSNNSYRGLVKIGAKAEGARNYSQCDSMLIGDKCGANTFPYIQVNNSTAKVEHEASTSKIGEDQLFYFASRGIGAEDAVSMIINGFVQDVFVQLPMEFAVEATKLLGLKLEGSVG
jgi:Fe-S cluster assembly protein SufB